MPELDFYFIDVFAAEPLTGNSLALVDGGEDLPDDVLGRIAREFNQSETTFVLPPTKPDADSRLRSFTPAGVEVFGAGGHNTLGAWWWLAESGRLTLAGDETVLHQEIGGSVLPVTIVHPGGRLERVVLDQQPAEAGAVYGDLEALAAALRLAPADVATDRVPCQVVSTGAPHLLVPLRNREAVDRVRPNAEALLALLRGVGGEGCYVFSLDPLQPTATAYARFFNPTVGIAEDPATGTAAGPLAAHLLAHGVVAPGAVVIEQGTAMGRTSLIRVEASAGVIRVSGRGVTVASGRLHL